jgi:glycosyltransferase involved in cell wall biosynthesis
MKIAVSTRLFIPEKRDGIGTFTKEVFQYLSNKYQEHEFHFIFDRAPSPTIQFSKNVVVHVVGPPTRHYSLTYLWYNISVALILKKIKPDIFISPDGVLPIFSKVPSIPVLHDLAFEVRPNDLPFLVRTFLKKTLSAAAKRAARVATVSTNSKNDIEKHYKVPAENIDIIYSGISNHFSPIGTDAQKVIREKFTNGQAYFIFVGTVLPRKNLLNLLKAFDLFKKQSSSPMKFVVVGNVWLWEKELQDTYENMQFKNDVVLAGRLEDKEVADLYASSFAVTYVSHYEGFGLPVLEAFNSGVPLITSTTSCLPEIAGDAALFANPSSPQDIASAMNKLYLDAHLHQQLIELGTQRKNKFTWSDTAELLWQSVLKVKGNA